MEGTRSHALAFLQGLALDAYVTTGAMVKWAICVDSPALLDDLQILLTRIGIVHSRIRKWNSRYEKHYDEIYASGAEAQRLLRLVPFMEPDKATRALGVVERRFSQSPWDIVPGITPRELAGMLPKGRPGPGGRGTSMVRFSFLRDPRTRHLSRRTLERVAALPTVWLPSWLEQVLDENWHFSPIVRIAPRSQ
jgi:hypothetical protein